ncbi:hypothetical protein [Actinomadura rupiterrae]|uniref:hypothetical protein n=1 Tax=Actinomadura rupiterrae TaxID=559627 RepID=UPI0020A55A26|nr:hypothetical protein [Actinomadura rupiterrae]MCP2336700.1 hypothetical protein [Actinomadura rupiterrae]
MEAEDERRAEAEQARRVEAGDERRVEVAAERLKERIYATITMVAVTIGLALGGHVGPAGAALSVLGTAAGLWMATLVADGQAYRTVHRELPMWPGVRRSLYVTSPLLLSAVSPLLLIGAAALDLMPLRTALLTATGLDVLSLFLWGYVGGRRMGDRPIVALVAGVLDCAVGAIVVAVKVLAGH